jgi:hypothetical protein
MAEISNELVKQYFHLLGQNGNTKRSSEACCISVSTGRTIERRYPDLCEGAMFEYRETLRGILYDRINDPALYSDKLLLKELEVVDNRYRNKLDVQHNVSVELVGRLQRAKARMLEATAVDGIEPRDERGTVLLEASRDSKAPVMREYLDNDEEKKSGGEIIEAEFNEL